ncbi:hypothetical protein ID866_4855 [Astraeus odoratus]|nr:hypothetical protein ID866_4855 [Astraeus odoratus]
MYKPRHNRGSPDYVPSTPKFAKLSLPPDETSQRPSRPPTTACARPPTPAMASTNPRLHPTSGQPARPLKSILKKPGQAAADRTSYDSEGETLTSKQVPRSGVYAFNAQLPGVRMVPMKPPAFDLHWQLLPYDPSKSKHLLRFDTALPVEYIRFQEKGYRRKLTDADLDKPAANGQLTKMQIDFKMGPFEWEVHVKNSEGITCGDVFEAIYETFDEQLTPYERKQIPPQHRKECEEAFKLRCQVKPGLAEVELRQGLKRVDVLRHGTIFLGLTQPKSGGDWVLNLGGWPYTV